MAAQNYLFSVRSAGSPVPGLSPTFVGLVKVADGDDVTQPTIFEVDDTKAPGVYKFSYDPAVPAVGQIDAGATVPDPGDRYIDVACL